MTGEQDANWFYLHGGGLRVAVGRKTGTIGPIYHLARNERCTMVSSDSYYLETRKSANEFGEQENTVVASARKDGLLRLECRHEKIRDVHIVQTYAATTYGISKTTEFVSRGTLKDLFLTVRTGAVLDEDFRRNGWYLGADHGLGGRLDRDSIQLF